MSSFGLIPPPLGITEPLRTRQSRRRIAQIANSSKCQKHVICIRFGGIKF